MNLAGKRLLILGGTYNAIDIREYASEQRITLIATGDNPLHPLWKIADETYLTDVTDVDDIVSLVEKQSIDGIFTGGNEDFISIMFDIVDKTGVPFYATRNQWEITGNKRKFKDECILAGLPVVPEYYISRIASQEELAAIEYPVVIKPVDGSGSRGVFLCETEEQLLKAQPEAIKYSRSHTLMVEKYMSGFVIVFYITVIDGEFYIASMCDKYTGLGTNHTKKLATIAQAYLYPSRYLDSCIEKYFSAIKRLLQNLKITNGVVGIQGFCDNGEIVFTEMGYRLGGTSQQNYTKALYGSSNMFLLMNYALSGKMTDEPYYENPFFPKLCCTVQLINAGGRVGQVTGEEYVKNMAEVIYFETHYKVGDFIPVVDNVSMVHYRIFIIANDMKHLKATIKKIQNTIQVWDDNGNYMLDDDFDVERLGTQ